MEFPLKFSTKYLTSKLGLLVRYWVEYEKRNVIYFTSNQYYFAYHINTIGIYWLDIFNKRARLRMVNDLPIILEPDGVAWEASDVSEADWRNQTVEFM